MSEEIQKKKNESYSIIQSDITNVENVDVIVNAANNQLLPGGGVCGAIFSAAEDNKNGLNKECEKYIKDHGELPVSGVATTESYNLKKQGIKKIIHAVGPIYDEQNPEKSECELEDAIFNVLYETFVVQKLNSVAIPAISSGIFGFPKDKCAQVFKRTIPLDKDIRLCNFDRETCTIFRDAFKDSQYKFNETYYKRLSQPIDIKPKTFAQQYQAQRHNTKQNNNNFLLKLLIYILITGPKQIFLFFFWNWIKSTKWVFLQLKWIFFPINFIQWILSYIWWVFIDKYLVWLFKKKGTKVELTPYIIIQQFKYQNQRVMENMKNSQNIKGEIESQLRNALIEIKTIKQENQYLQQQCSQLKEKLNYSLKAQDSIIEVEQNYKKALQENKLLQNELAFYQGCIQTKEQTQSTKPTYQQIENELEDMQQMFKKYYALQDKYLISFISLINQLPIQIVKECWQAINQTFKSNFNCYQTMQSQQDELKQMEQEYKISIHTTIKDLNSLQEIARQQKIHDLRVEIERIRKEIQRGQQESKKLDSELIELENEFQYVCRIEARRFNQQIEQEKQLINLKQKTENRDYFEQRARQQSDYFNEKQSIRNDSMSSFKKPLMLRVTKNNDEMIRATSDADRTQIEKTIDQTRKKLSRQLSLASNLSRNEGFRR